MAEQNSADQSKLQESPADLGEQLLRLVGSRDLDQNIMSGSIASMVRRGADLNRRDPSGASSLSLAISNGYTAIALIIADGIARDSKIPADIRKALILSGLRLGGNSPELSQRLGALSDKLHSDNPISLSSFLGGDATATGVANERGTKLINMIAAHNGPEDYIITDCRNLLDAGASILVTNDEERSALEFAARKGYVRLTEILSERLELELPVEALPILKRALEAAAADNDITDSICKRIQMHKLAIQTDLKKETKVTSTKQGVNTMGNTALATAFAAEVTGPEKLGLDIIENIKRTGVKGDQLDLALECAELMARGADLLAHDNAGKTAYDHIVQTRVQFIKANQDLWGKEPHKASGATSFMVGLASMIVENVYKKFGKNAAATMIEKSKDEYHRGSIYMHNLMDAFVKGQEEHLKALQARSVAKSEPQPAF